MNLLRKKMGRKYEGNEDDLIILDDNWFVYDGDIACVGLLTSSSIVESPTMTE